MRIFCLLLVFVFAITIAEGQAIIAGKLVNAEMSVTLKLYRNGTTSPAEEMKISISKGQFQQVIKTTGPILFELNDGLNKIEGIIEPNDRILFSYDRQSIQHSFSIDGPGREKSQFLHQLNKTKEDTASYLDLSRAGKMTEAIDLALKNIDSSEQYFNEQLQNLKQYYTTGAVELLSAEIDAKFLRQRYQAMKRLMKGGWAEVRMQQYFTGGEFRYKAEAGISPNYIDAVYNILSDYWDALKNYESSKTGQLEMLEMKYEHLRSLLKPELESKVLTLFLEKDIRSINSQATLEKLLEKIYRRPTDKIYSTHIRTQYKKLSVPAR